MTTIISTPLLAVPGGWGYPGAEVKTTTVRAVITPDDLATAGNTPVELVPAAGIGTTLACVIGVVQYKAGTVGYNNDSTVAILIGSKPVMTSGSAPNGTIVFSATVDQVCFLANVADNEPQANHENAPLLFQCQDGDPGGSGNGLVMVEIRYTIVPLIG